MTDPKRMIPMNERLSPRELIAIFSSLLLLLALSILAVGSGLTLQASHVNDLDAVLSEQSRILLTEAQTTDNPNLKDERIVTQALRLRTGSSVAALYRNETLVWKGGAIQAPSEPLDLKFFSNLQRRSVVTINDWRILSRREGDLIVQVAQPLASLNATMQTYWRTTLIGTILLTLISGFALNVMLKALIRPLGLLAARVQNLDSTAAIPATRVKGEIGILARGLEKSITDLRETRAREARFLADASHELRTPITALLADLEHSLSRSRSQEDLLGVLTRAQKSAVHMRDLASNLLALSKSGAGGEPVRVEVDLLDVALEVTDRLVPLAAQKGLGLDADGDSAVVQGDPVLIARMLENLVSNAIKYSTEGNVSVHIATHPYSATVTVTDSGIGIPEDKLEHLFEPFKRAHLEHRDGFGLGLAVVKSITEAHGGQVKISSEVDVGTSIEIALPVKPNRSTI
jgi:signal transduction histidine kinase